MGNRLSLLAYKISSFVDFPKLLCDEGLKFVQILSLSFFGKRLRFKLCVSAKTKVTQLIWSQKRNNPGSNLIGGGDCDGGWDFLLKR